MKKWMRLFTAGFALVMIGLFEFFFCWILFVGPVELYEDNRAILITEVIVFGVIILYCLYRVVDEIIEIERNKR